MRICGRLKVQVVCRPSTIVRYSSSSSHLPVIKIERGTFYRHRAQGQTSIEAASLFKNFTFELPSSSASQQHWAIIGPSLSGKTTLLQILQGQHLCFPPQARSFPFLSSDSADRRDLRRRDVIQTIRYVGFGGEGLDTGQDTKGAYLSARYESRQEDTDFTVLQYLLGTTELNPYDDADSEQVDEKVLQQVIRDLNLTELVDMPVSNLSNGQTRRAKIARALMGKPEVLLLDEPFMGLDPHTMNSLSPLLHRLADASAPRLILTLRSQDSIPEWITHLIYLDRSLHKVQSGTKGHVLRTMGRYAPEPGFSLRDDAAAEEVVTPSNNQSAVAQEGILGEPLIEMEGAKVSYGDRTVLGNWEQIVHGEKRDGLWWTVRRGERWGIFGPNGSGKTTILSLICSDHPQTYSLPVRLFGRSRLPEPGQPGTSIFQIQARIGHSSPEIHNFIPKEFTLRQVLESAWADTFRGVPKLTEANKSAVEACLRWFGPELNPNPTARYQRDLEYSEKFSWPDAVLFGGSSFSSQRVALFLRAVIKKPDVVILDEAFSGMDSTVRDKCMLFLTHGENKVFEYKNDMEHGRTRTIVESQVSKDGAVQVGGLSSEQALLCISHVKEEVPHVIREWICLPEANASKGEPARFGKLDGLIQSPMQGGRQWNKIWGVNPDDQVNPRRKVSPIRGILT